MKIKLQNLRPGKVYNAQVRAVSATGEVSEFSPTYQIDIASDTTPPPTPSAPTCTSRLGTVTVAWDGLGSLGESMPADFNHVEVHYSTSTGFTPDSTTLHGALLGKDSIVFSDLTYNTTYYFKFKTVDNTGNTSAASAQASQSVTPLVDSDVIGEVIDGANIINDTITASDKVIANTITGGLIQGDAIAANHLQANSVTTDKLDVGAVTAEKISLGVIASNMIGNPGFEELDANQYGVSGAYWPTVVRWERGVRYTGGHQPEIDVQSTTYWARGGQSAAVVFCDSAEGADGGYIMSEPFPVPESTDWTFGLHAMGDSATRSVAGMPLLTARLVTAATETPVSWTESANGIESMALGYANPGDSTPATTAFYQELYTTSTIPAGHYWARLKIYNDGSATSGTENSWIVVDDTWAVLNGVGASELTASGLRLFNSDGVETVRLSGAPVDNNYARFGSASIDADGNVSGSILTADQALYYQGDELGTLLSDPPRGMVAYAIIGSASPQYNTTEYGLFQIAVSVEAGRSYKIVYDGIIHMESVGYTVLSFRASTSGPPQTSSTRLKYTGYPFPVAPGSFDCRLETIWTAPSTGTIYVLVTARTSTGQGWSEADRGSLFYVEDIGVGLEIGESLNNGGGSASAPPQTYVKTYNATWSRAYDGSGNYESWHGSECLFGYYSSTNGNQKSMIGFPTLTTDLSGSTVSKVEVYLYANHWYYNSGGTMVLGVHGQSSAPATFSGTSNITQSAGWPNPGGRWVTLSSSTYAGFISGSNKGIVLGPGPSTSSTYYGRANGYGMSYAPQLRITYTK